MNRRRRANPAPAPRSAAPPVRRFQGATLAAATGLMVVSVLTPSESAARTGSYALLSVGWLLLLAACWAAALWRRRAVRGFDEVDLLLVALLGWHTASALIMAPEGNARQCLNVLWVWIAMGAAFLVFRSLADSPAARRALLAVLTAVAAGLSAHGLYQYAVSMPALVQAYEARPEAEKQQLLRENAIDPRPTSPQRRQFEDRLRSSEPYATFGLANSLAGVLAPALIVALGLALAAPSTAEPRRVWLGAGAAAALVAVCLVLTKSRAAWLAAALGLVLLWAWDWGTERRLGWAALALTLLGLGLIAGAGLAVGALDAEVATQAWMSLSYRLQYWTAALSLLTDHPWFGCGPGNFQQFYPAYKLPAASETVADPHNFWLEVGATAGAPAAILLTLLLAAMGRRMLATSPPPETASEVSEPTGAAVTLGLLGGYLAAIPYALLIGFPLESFVAVPLPVPLVVGLPVSLLTLATLFAWTRSGHASRRLPALAALVLLVNLLAAGGIGFPGVALVLWLLLALALTGRPATPAPATGRLLAAGCCLSLGLAVAAVFTEYLPVVAGQTALRAAFSAPSAAAVEQRLRAAADIDPRAAEPWRHLCEVAHAQWLAQPDPATWTRFERYVAEARRHDRRSRQLESRLGELYLLAWRKRDRAGALEQAIEAFRRAVVLDPNHNLTHAQLAWTLHLAGQHRAAADSAETALELDALNPHWEQQLARQRLFDPAGRSAASPAGPGDANAEQLMLRLRMTGQGPAASRPTPDDGPVGLQ